MNNSKMLLIVGGYIATYERTIKKLLDNYLKENGNVKKILLLDDTNSKNFNDLIISWCSYRKIDYNVFYSNFVKYGRTAKLYRDNNIFKNLRQRKDITFLCFEDYLTKELYKYIYLAILNKVNYKIYTLPRFTKKGEEKLIGYTDIDPVKVEVLVNRFGYNLKVESNDKEEVKLLLKHDKEEDRFFMLELCCLIAKGDYIITGRNVTRYKENRSILQPTRFIENNEFSNKIKLRIIKSRSFTRVHFVINSRIFIKLVLNMKIELHVELLDIISKVKLLNNTSDISNSVYYVLESLLSNRINQDLYSLTSVCKDDISFIDDCF